MPMRRRWEIPVASERQATWKAPWLTLLAIASVVLSACEDQGNPGDDNLLTGGSLVLVVIVVLVIVYFVRRRK